MPRQTRFVIFTVVVLLVIGLVSWTIWLKPKSQTRTTTQEQPQFLADSEYQQQVTTVLSGLASASDDSWKQQLDSSLASLQVLRVSSQVKYDHLLLFTALDLWKADNLTASAKTNVKTKLQTFGQHQPWSQTAIDSLITRGNLAS